MMAERAWTARCGAIVPWTVRMVVMKFTPCVVICSPLVVRLIPWSRAEPNSSPVPRAVSVLMLVVAVTDSAIVMMVVMRSIALLAAV